VNKTAYVLYLKAGMGCNKRDRSGLSNCLEYLERFIAADPEFAPPHAAFAEALVAMAIHAEARPHESDAVRQNRGDAGEIPTLNCRTHIPHWPSSQSLRLGPGRSGTCFSVGSLTCPQFGHCAEMVRDLLSVSFRPYDDAIA
jgi:hypothetical protein